MIFLCLKVFFCRVFDVSLGTIRTLLNVKGKSFIAAVIAFIEAGVWFLVIREALVFEGSPYLIALAYSLGYALGTFLGGTLVKIFTKTTVSVQIITEHNENVLNTLKGFGYSYTLMKGKGSKNLEMNVIVCEINGKDLPKLKKIIYDIDPTIFITVSETKRVYNGSFVSK